MGNVVYPNPALLREVREYLAMSDPAKAGQLARLTKAVIFTISKHFTDISAGDNLIETRSVSEGEALVLPIVKVGKVTGNISGDKIQIKDETGAVRATIDIVTNGEVIGDTVIVRLDVALEAVHTYTFNYVAEAAITGAHLTVSLEGFRLTVMPPAVPPPR